MPCKRNEEAVNRICNAARDIMMTRGYEAMTYSELAQKTGLPRGTVQYYFPKKEELAKSFMGTVAAVATQMAQKILGDNAPAVAVIYATAQIVVAFYYSTPGLRKFMLDISTDRRLQHAVSPDWNDWIREISGKDDLALAKGQIDTLSMATGAVHEMHYIYLSEGRTPLFAKLNREATLAQAKALGFSTREANAMLRQGTLTQEYAQQLAEELYSELQTTEIGSL